MKKSELKNQIDRLKNSLTKQRIQRLGYEETIDRQADKLEKLDSALIKYKAESRRRDQTLRDLQEAFNREVGKEAGKFKETIQRQKDKIIKLDSELMELREKGSSMGFVVIPDNPDKKKVFSEFRVYTRSFSNPIIVDADEIISNDVGITLLLENDVVGKFDGDAIIAWTKIANPRK